MILNRKITKRVVSITKDETENKGITKSDIEDLEISISSKLGIDPSKVFDLPLLKVVPDMKVKILKEDGSDYASNMSTITKSL